MEKSEKTILWVAVLASFIVGILVNNVDFMQSMIIGAVVAILLLSKKG